MKHILLMITGSIAAPKALLLYEKLKKQYQVTLVSSPSANKFVKFPKNIPVYQQFLEKDFYQKTDKISHTDLALHHDLIVVYPATMNFISKAALAIPDNLVLATFLASNAKKLIFPAMNNNMYRNHAFQNNCKMLQGDSSITIIEPNSGMLACNVVGIGRLKEPDEAEIIINNLWTNNETLAIKTVLINYGATKTYLDDIRFITNNSSGKMGEALVAACLQQGAKVIAISASSCPINLQHANLTTIAATTNQEMLHEMEKYYGQADLVLCAAALNDYVSPDKKNGKISKKAQPNWQINLVPNIDVLKTLGAKKQQQILIGFAAEASNDIRSKEKMVEKNCDGIVINNIKVMGQDKTAVQFLFGNETYNFSGTKAVVATEIIAVISNSLKNNKE